VGKREAWIAANARACRAALSNAQVRADVLALLGVDGSERLRLLRLEEVRRDLEELELRWKVGEEWESWK
jgi:DNA transposition AAA+ family ATPase